MSDYDQLLQATENYLLSLKARGVRYVNVRPESLTALPASSAVPQHVAVPAAAPEEEVPSNIIPLPAVAETASPSNATPVAAAEASEVSIENATAEEDKDSAMASLRERAHACLKCPNLVRSRKNVVFGVGDIRSPLMFVGEAPGADEDEQGEPFVGAAGQLLTRIIKTMGLSRETVYIANILKCRPDTPGQTAGNRKPTADEMKTCLPFLLAQVDVIKPKVIVALGATAVEGLLGVSGGITKLRGKFQKFRDIPLMPTFHPAYLLRNQALSEKRKVWEDMLQVMTRLEMPISEKQRSYFLSA